MQFKKSLTLITAASSIACMAGYADQSSNTSNNTSGIAKQVIKYLNSTWYQTPKKYQELPQALQKMLRFAADNNGTNSTKNITDTIQLKLNFLDDEAKKTYDQMGENTGSSWLGLTPNATDTRSQSMMRMYCGDSKQKDQYKICSDIITKGLPLNVAIGGDRLLYLLADRTTSSNFSIPAPYAILNKAISASGQSYTPISNMKSYDAIVDYNAATNDEQKDLTAGNYLAQYLSGAYMLNTALNPCFGSDVLIKGSASDAQKSTTSKSDKKNESTQAVDPCSGGKNLVRDLYKLIAQDKKDNEGCQQDQSKCSLYELTTSPAYFRYQLDLRSNIARSSLPLANFYYLFKEHVQTSQKVKLPKVIESDQLPHCAQPKEGGKVTDSGSGCSRAQLEQFIANYRLKDTSWLNRIKTASPTLIMREQALMNAESLQVLQHMEIDLERILASTTLTAADQNYTLFSKMSGDITSLDKKMTDLLQKAKDAKTQKAEAEDQDASNESSAADQTADAQSSVSNFGQ